MLLKISSAKWWPFCSGGYELINSRTHSLGLFTHIHVSVNFSSSLRLPFLSILFGNYTTLGRDQFLLKIKRHKNFIIVHHSTLGRIGKRVRIGNNKKCIIFVSEFLAQCTIKDRMQQSVFDKTFRIQYKLGYHVLLIEVQTVLYTWFIKYENIKAICMMYSCSVHACKEWKCKTPVNSLRPSDAYMCQ